MRTCGGESYAQTLWCLERPAPASLRCVDHCACFSRSSLLVVGDLGLGRAADLGFWRAERSSAIPAGLRSQAAVAMADIAIGCQCVTA